MPSSPDPRTIPLPIDAVLPELRMRMRESACVVLQAPPGSGKTTRVPLELLPEPWLCDGRIVMLEPRRLAAMNAAGWMASCLREGPGGIVGYTIRFDRKISRRTRIEVVTEGILTRRLQSDPFLEGVGAVIFDEFHERSIHADLALALCRDIQREVRPDLRILVMSATMDTSPISRLLDHAPVVSGEGRSYPVELRYLPQEPEGRLPQVVARGVMTALREERGDILVFLPGAGEIRSCQRELAESVPPGVRLLPLYGDLPFVEQERALLTGPERRVILATAIAETSLTIQGVDTVVDGGFSRRLGFNPATGLNRLVTTRVTAASADQRAGRAGRLGPGVCYRLWTEFRQKTLLPFDPPEIHCADLAPLALDLAAWGVADPSRLAWLDPPPEQSYRAAVELLHELGALDGHGIITVTGRAMSRLPVHPRLARMLLDAKSRGLGPLGCDLAAILGERDLFRDRRPAHAGRCDLSERIEALAGWRHKRADAALDDQACRTVDRSAREYRRLLELPDGQYDLDSEKIASLLLLAYPDRIGRHRGGEGGRYLLASGRGAVLSPRSALHAPPFLVAPVVDGGEQGDGSIMLGSSLSLDLLRRECADRIVRQRRVEWDLREQRVVARTEERLGAVVLSAQPVTPERDELAGALLAGLAAGPGLAALSWSREATQFRARVMFLRRVTGDDGWPDLSDAWLLSHLADWLGPYVEGCRSLADLRRIDLLPALKGILSWERQRRLDEGAPVRFGVPSGSRIELDYDTDGAPVLAVKLQELFGLADTPTVAWGRVPLLLHLLSPARRPIQVTQDLRRFWDTVYHEVKRELKGRYPKHPWPDDPWNAVPTRHTRRRD